MNPANPSDASTLGTLFLVGTPIGNLEDMSFRGIRMLKEADYLYCEDTRRTSILLAHFQIDRKTAPRSFHDHSPQVVQTQIRELLEQGRSIAYVSDGGLPVVSDPGFVLVRVAHSIGAPVVAIPGPSAATLVFAASGLASPKFLFHGFFPRTRGEVERTIEVIRTLPVVHIFYEAPGRIVGTMGILSKNLGDAPAALGRELTKVYEELLRGTISKLHEELAARDKVRGECVIAILGGGAGAKAARDAAKTAENQPQTGNLVPPHLDRSPPPTPEERAAEIAESLTEEQQAEILSRIKSGVSSKDAAKELSKKFGVSRRVIYEFIIHRLT